MLNSNCLIANRIQHSTSSRCFSLFSQTEQLFKLENERKNNKLKDSELAEFAYLSAREKVY